MRFTLTILAWIVMVGGLGLYVSWRETAPTVGATSAPEVAAAAGSYDIELTTTFSIEKDPFALQLDDAGSEALTVRLNGAALAVKAEDLSRGRALRLQRVSGIVDGANEIYVEASPPVDEVDLTQGIRVRVLQEELVLADQTLWGEQGALVSGSVGFSTAIDAEGDHDH